MRGKGMLGKVNRKEGKWRGGGGRRGEGGVNRERREERGRKGEKCSTH